jgi:hypothetical protein
VSAAAGEDGKALDDYYAALYALDLAGSRDTAPLYEKCGDIEFRSGRYHEAALEYARAIASQPSASFLPPLRNRPPPWTAHGVGSMRFIFVCIFWGRLRGLALANSRF